MNVPSCVCVGCELLIRILGVARRVARISVALKWGNQCNPFLVGAQVYGLRYTGPEDGSPWWLLAVLHSVQSVPCFMMNP